MEYSDVKRTVKRNGKTVALCRERLPRPHLRMDEMVRVCFKRFIERRLAPLAERNEKVTDTFVPAIAELYATRREDGENTYELRITLPDGTEAVKLLNAVATQKTRSKRRCKMRNAAIDATAQKL